MAVEHTCLSLCILLDFLSSGNALPSTLYIGQGTKVKSAQLSDGVWCQQKIVNCELDIVVLRFFNGNFSSFTMVA